MDKSKIPREYLPLFEDIDVFNEMQSQVFEDCVNMDSSIVVSAPTGSGKTTVFLFTAMRELMNQNWPHEKNVFRLIYIAPTRALVTETFEKWEEKFNKINIKCFEVTGETDITDLRELEEYHVLLTTPEKWDSLTRRWKENANFLKTVRLMMIDEIHLLNEERRGAVLETIICRTKIAALKSESVVRFIGISATLVNVEDVAKWFDVKNTKAHSICNNNSHGSKVNEEIVGVLLSAEESYFKVDAIMNSWVPEIVADNWKNQSTLIFCCTRMSAEITAKALLKNFPLTLELNQTNILENVSQQIENQDLRECLKSGYAFHHGGLNSDDRQIVEHLYRSGIISILICTQTLAMGVNLPTYLVIVKAPNPISPTEMLQMIGRAGRIGHRDDGGVAVIITRTCHAMLYQNLRDKIAVIESNLKGNLEEFVNTEIFTGNITNFAETLDWIKSTFFYVRLMENPTHYGCHQDDTVENHLQNVCAKTIDSLKIRGLVVENVNDEGVLHLTSTVYGSMVAKYFLNLETMKFFQEAITGDEKLSDLFNIVCKCSEFQQFTLRSTDKRILNEWNTCHATRGKIANHVKKHQSIRFPISGKIQSVQHKVSCILQAILGRFNVRNHQLRDEAMKIMKLANHLTKSLLEVIKIISREKFQAIESCLTLNKCFMAELWENSTFICGQIDGIDDEMTQLLLDSGISSFESLRSIHFRTINEIYSEHPELEKIISDGIMKIPQYSITSNWINDKTLAVTVSQNNEFCEFELSSAALIVGDADTNTLLFLNENICGTENTFETIMDINIKFRNIKVHLIHPSIVGVDIHLTVNHLSNKRQFVEEVKLEDSPNFVEKPDMEEMKPPSPKIQKKHVDDESHRGCYWWNEMQAMDNYRKSLPWLHDRSEEDPFDIGIESVLRQLDLSTNQPDEKMEVTIETPFAVSVVPKKPQSDLKEIYVKEFSKIIGKPFSVPQSQNLKDKCRKAMDSIIIKDN